MRRNFWYLTITLVVIVGTFVATLLSGNRPVLGLDLQGGISVVLQPVGEVKNEASLDKAVDIIRSRVDALGVAEPEISRQGSNVIIDLPGVRDRDKARRLVGKTAELRFRPVLAILPPETKTSTTTTTKKPETSTTVPGAAATSSTTAATTTTTTPEIKTSTPVEDKATATVVLPGRKTDDKQPIRYQLGPAALTGKGVSGAKAQFLGGSQGWVVDLSLKDDGAAAFNQLAKTSFTKQPPENAVAAIVLDGVVQSAPAFQTDSFDGDVQISGDFSEGDAKDLATVLQYGALPVQLKELTTQSVSPSLGTDQLRAGIAAGVIGLALVALYMLVFYRLLGVVVIIGLILAAMAIYSLISYLGSAIGLTLTLAGVTGLIVSVGVTVDSYVVYFEKLKDEVRTGRTVRSSVDRAFEKSFKTILAADLVSLIGAAVLYALAIGSVRGFAFFLGISVLLDLIIAYFFMHPLVYFMAQKSSLVKAPKVGIAAGLDAVGDGLMRPDGSRNTLKDLYHERTNFDFLHRRWRWALLSGIVLLAGALGLIVNGLNLGIDFTGGTVWELTAKQSPSSGDIRGVVAPLGVKEPKIVIVGSKGIRVQGEDLGRAKQDEITDALAKYGGVPRAEVSVSDVGPTWGNQVSGKALRALIIFFLVIALYLSLRFTIKMAIGAIAAVLHDIAITIGVYAITGFEVTPATVIAFLTILGFSLYDTVVVFDKIKENERLVSTTNNITYTDMANTSLNQVLMRSLNTSFVALLPVASLLVVGVWIYGALALRDFGLALFVGLLTGAYSSIFVATPILAWLKEREPKHRAVAERVETRAARAAAPEYQGEPAEKVPAGTSPAPAAAPQPASAGPAPAITPRPRQQRGRKRK